MSFADEMVKKIMQTTQNINPVSIYTGKVNFVDPLEIKLETGLVLTEDFLITLKDAQFSVNDAVIVFRIQGKANIFVVLGVIKNDTTGN